MSLLRPIVQPFKTSSALKSRAYHICFSRLLTSPMHVKVCYLIP